MRALVHRARTWFGVPSSGDSEHRDRAKFVHVVSLVLFLALFVPPFLRSQEELFRPISWALLAQQVLLIVAFLLNKRGKIDAAVILMVFGFLAMTGFILLASDDGLHDVALLIFPCVLVVAGIVFDRWIFVVFTVSATTLYASLALLELGGVVHSAMSRFTTAFDVVEGSMIMLMTAAVVGLLTKNLKDTLQRVRSSESALAETNQELQRQARMLRESEARYRLVVESAQDPIVSTDFRGQFLFANAAAARLSGYAIEDLLSKNFFDFCLPDQRERTRRAFFRQVTDRDPSRHHGVALQVRSGEVKWLSMNVSLEFREGSLNGFHVVARDITEQRAAEDEVRRLNEDLEGRVHQRTLELEAAMQELQSISYSVSHDLRAPLRHIGAYVEMTQARPAVREDSTAHRHLQTISFSAKWMGMLVDGLIDYLSIGQTEMHPAPVDLGDLVRGIIRDMEQETIGRFIRWKVGPLPTVTGDRRLLRQAFGNLIGNAVKFTQSRQESIIEIGTAAVEGSVPEHVVFIRDNGVGFDPQYQDRLFGLFERLHSRSEHSGTGIGLANVRRIIHRHHGRVWAEGAVDRGATFSVALPVRILQADDHERSAHGGALDAGRRNEQP